ncbi:hypothetical protein FQR65_LT11720 [Abscondita terminalis]|nr:hypothetical protein FQR65_LT11720 [Abscondita terminalis]
MSHSQETSHIGKSGGYRILQFQKYSPALLIRDPELIKQVLIKDFNYFNENDFDVDRKNDYLMAKNPFFSKGDDWKISRGQLSPSLTTNKMKNIFPLMEKVSKNFVEHLKNPIVANGESDIKTLCEKYTMDVAALTALGLEANSFKSVDTDFMSNVKKIISPGTLMSIKFTLLTLLPILAKFLKVKFIPDDAADYFRSTIKNALEYRQKNGIIRNDFLQTMQELQEKVGDRDFSNDDITSHSLSFFIDGFETSSVLLSFVLYELGANVQHQETLRDEIENSLKVTNGNLSFDSIHEMTYLNKFLNESMRLHPPGFYLSRRCTKSYLLPPLENRSKDVVVEPGTPIVIPVYSLHYDSKYYPDPEKFNPERFSNNFESLTKYTFFPFGDGPRMCIGQKYAIAQIKVAVVYLVLNYDIRLNPKTNIPLQIDPSYFLLQPKGGIWSYPNLRYVGIYKARQPAILIQDPELIKNVLITDFSYFSDTDANVDKKNDYLMSKNPFFSKGVDWKTNRGHLTSCLTSNKIKTIFPLMKMVCQNFIDYLGDPNDANERINSKTLCEKYTMDVAALSVLGLEGNSFKSINTDYLSNIQKIVSPGILMSIKFTLLKVMPIMANFLKIKYVTEDMNLLKISNRYIPDDAAIYFKNIIKSTLHFRKENNIKRNDFLNSMQELGDKLGHNRFSVDDITALCLSFFVGGFETSSIALSFALYDLGVNIEHQDKLRKEIEKSVKCENNKITYESISELTYLNNILSESLRLHSPVLFLSRRCTKFYQLPPADNNSKELLIEPGTPIIIPVYGLHYDSKYFENPKKFDPDRFSEHSSINEYTFLPFGGGPRVCVGQKYAIAQIKIALVYLVLHYDIRINPKTMSPLEIDSKHFLLSPVGGIWIDFTKRIKYQ